MSTMGSYSEYHGGVKYRGGYHDAGGGYHEYRGGIQYHGGYHPLKFEYRGDIMLHVGDTMSTVESVQHRGVLK